MKSLKYYLAVLCIGFISTTYSAGYADAYFYKAKPGKLAEAAELMREGRDIGLANDQLVIVHQQNIGRGAEKMFLWVDFFNTYEDRAKAYTAEAWTPYLEKFNSQDILEPVRSYQMTSLDDIDPGDYIVQVWVWDPKKGKAAETLEALEEAKTIFEKHGFLIDLWQHGLGSKNYYQFVMLSTSEEAQAKSLSSLESDTEWQEKQMEWFDEEKYGKLVESYQVTSLN